MKIVGTHTLKNRLLKRFIVLAFDIDRQDRVLRMSVRKHTRRVI